MKRSLLVLLALFWVAAAQAQELPEYKGKLYVTAVYSANFTPDDAALARFLREDPRMNAFCQRVVFNEFNDNTRLIKETSWAARLGTERPALLIQSSHDTAGQADVLFYAKGKQVYDGTYLRAIDHALKAYAQHVESKSQRPFRPICPGPDCPQPQPPAPTPAPAVPQPLVPTVLPELQPTPVPVVPEINDESGLPLLLLILAGLGGAGGGIWSKLNDES